MYLSLLIPIPNLLQIYNIFGMKPNAILLYGGNLLLQAISMNELMDIFPRNICICLHDDALTGF